MRDMESKLNFPSFMRFLQSSVQEKPLLPLYYTSSNSLRTTTSNPSTQIQIISPPQMSLNSQKVK